MIKSNSQVSISSAMSSHLNHSLAKNTYKFGSEDRFGMQFKPAYNPVMTDEKLEEVTESNMMNLVNNKNYTDFIGRSQSVVPFNSAGLRFQSDYKSKYFVLQLIAERNAMPGPDVYSSEEIKKTPKGPSMGESREKLIFNSFSALPLRKVFIPCPTKYNPLPVGKIFG